MKMYENQKNYQPLIILIDKPFKKLSKQESQKYFDWFVSHVDERSDYIRQKVSQGLGISIETLDFSMDSLIPIWKWFFQVAEITKTPKKVLKDIKKSLKGQQPEFIEDMLNESREELSIFTQYVLRDIGMYVGKMFVTNYESLKWDYHTDIEKDSFANIPQIFGFVNNDYGKPFYDAFEPIHISVVQASNLFDKTNKDEDLYNICKRWTQWIPKK